MKTDNHVVCDLGGVLIHLDWIEKMQTIFPELGDHDQILTMWLSLSSVKDFESGNSDFNQFYEAFQGETGISMSQENFRRDFCSIIGPVKERGIEILDEIRERANLSLLSNTNPLHIETLTAQTDLLSHFDQLFLSYEMGLVKPDVAIYREVCRRLNTTPESVYFFDDNRENIAAATACGINAYCVSCPAEILEILSAQKWFGVV